MVHCFAPMCKTSYPSDRLRNKLLGKKNLSTFKAPRDPELLKKWQSVIPRKDKVFSSKDRLCELHFDEECIIRHFESELADGSTFKLERGRCVLRPNSVPTKFPNVPYLPFHKNKRKAPTVRKNCLKKRSHLDRAPTVHNDSLEKQSHFDEAPTVSDESLEKQTHFDKTLTIHNNTLEKQSHLAVDNNSLEKQSYLDKAPTVHNNSLEKQSYLDKAPTVHNNSLEKQSHHHDDLVLLFEIESNQQSFVTLSQRLQEVKVPDPSWTVFFHQGYIMCTSWKELVAERRVIVFEDFSIKIFLRKIEVSETDMLVKAVENADCLSLLLHQVNNLIICDGVEYEKVVDCKGYVKPTNLHPKNRQCDACRKYLEEKRLEAKKVEEELSIKMKIQKVLQEKKNILKRNGRLLKTVERLKAKVKRQHNLMNEILKEDPF